MCRKQLCRGNVAAVFQVSDFCDAFDVRIKTFSFAKRSAVPPDVYPSFSEKYTIIIGAAPVGGKKCFCFVCRMRRKSRDEYKSCQKSDCRLLLPTRKSLLRPKFDVSDAFDIKNKKLFRRFVVLYQHYTFFESTFVNQPTLPLYLVFVEITVRDKLSIVSVITNTRQSTVFNVVTFAKKMFLFKRRMCRKRRKLRCDTSTY